MLEERLKIGFVPSLVNEQKMGGEAVKRWRACLNDGANWKKRRSADDSSSTTSETSSVDGGVSSSSASLHVNVNVGRSYRNSNSGASRKRKQQKRFICNFCTRSQKQVERDRAVIKCRKEIANHFMQFHQGND